MFDWQPAASAAVAVIPQTRDESVTEREASP